MQVQEADGHPAMRRAPKNQADTSVTWPGHSTARCQGHLPPQPPHLHRQRDPAPHGHLPQQSPPMPGNRDGNILAGGIQTPSHKRGKKDQMSLLAKTQTYKCPPQPIPSWAQPEAPRSHLALGGATGEGKNQGTIAQGSKGSHPTSATLRNNQDTPTPQHPGAPCTTDCNQTGSTSSRQPGDTTKGHREHRRGPLSH